MPLFAVCSFVLATGAAKCRDPMNAEAAIAAVIASNQITGFDPKTSTMKPYTILPADKRPAAEATDRHFGVLQPGTGTPQP